MELFFEQPRILIPNFYLTDKIIDELAPSLKNLVAKISGIYTGTSESVRHFNKTKEFIVPAKSLRQMPTVTNGISGLSINPYSFSHSINVGTDCLVMAISVWRSGVDSRANAVSLGAQGLTQVSTGVLNATQFGAQLWYLKNPAPGPGTLSITFANTPTYSLVTCSNWQGTLVSPFRAISTTTGTVSPASLAPISAVGDIVLDVLGLNTSAPWTPGAGQAQISALTSVGPNYSMTTSQKPGTAGTTSMGESGANNPFAYLAVALAGS